MIPDKAAEDDMVGILLVDDDSDCLVLVREAIKEVNILNPVYEVTSGEEALDFLYRRGSHARAPKIGLVYLDVEMPGLTGQEVLKALRSDRRFDRLPIVMMTGLEDDKEKSEAAQNGANSYTVKSNDPAEFLNTVVRATNYWVAIHEPPSSEASVSD